MFPLTEEFILSWRNHDRLMIAKKKAPNYFNEYYDEWWRRIFIVWSTVREQGRFSKLPPPPTFCPSSISKMEMSLAHAADTEYLVRQAMNSGYQWSSLLVPPAYIVYTIARKGRGALSLNRFLRATWLGGLGGTSFSSLFWAIDTRPFYC